MSTPEQRELMLIGLEEPNFFSRAPYRAALQALLADAERLERLEAALWAYGRAEVWREDCEGEQAEPCGECYACQIATVLEEPA